MSDLGDRYRELFDRIAPPIEPRSIARQASQQRGWSGLQIGLASALGVIVVVGAIFVLMSGGPTASVSSSTTEASTTSLADTSSTTTTTTVAITVEPQVLSPDVFCSAEVPASPCSNLVDGDLSADWQAPGGGVGESISLSFAEPVSIVDLSFSGIPDQARYIRNSRPKDIRVVGYDDDSLRTVVFQLAEDDASTQTFTLGWSNLTAITLTIQSAYPGRTYQDHPAFLELTLAEVQVRGFTGPMPRTDSTATTVAAPALSGIWQQTNPDLGGLYVQVRDMIWDGESFYVLTRIGFGDLEVWRSADGIEWSEYSQIGTSGTVDGPWSLVSMDGKLYAGGRRDTVATVWIDEGTTPWREVTLGEGTIRDITFYNDGFVAVGQTPAPVDLPGPTDPRHAVIWTSPDAETWTEVAGADLFGEGTYPSRLEPGPAGLLTIVATGTDPRIPTTLVVAMSRDGHIWTTVEPTGLALTQITVEGGGSDGYLANDGIGSAIYQSADGANWTELPFDDSLVSDVGGTAFFSDFTHLGDTLVVTGSIFVAPADGSYNYSLPAVWAYLGGTWTMLGSEPWFTNQGYTYRVVAGTDRLVVYGEKESENWALFTFVANEP